MAPRDIAPRLFGAASRKECTVYEALSRDNWLHDLDRNWRDDMIEELINLSSLLSQTQLNPLLEDHITWKFTDDGSYSTRSAYLLQFEGMIKSHLYNSVWRGWAPAKCKIFLWMAMQRKILTADVLLLRGWDNNYFCPLCMRCLETAAHLFSECSWSRRVWDSVAAFVNLPSFASSEWNVDAPLHEWLQELTPQSTDATHRRGTQALAMLICWELWLERNRRIFHQQELPLPTLVNRIRDEAAVWKLAGCPIPFDPG